ncbi:hypothetical protein [Bifidobacterium vansinderenii]|uniref:Uncharacterized protein n=1 Tax=Bifidobacterium vansinderenii TaxID=1984871 RepID=A0A229VWP6_9BIFI|nr:hypothetical protein [Bifidobacterium vansinderenii]OXN00051.1 hypothetical protein Tam10B_1686 [Bifidobacterium vansinderenii]
MQTLTINGKAVTATIDWYVFDRALGAMSHEDRNELDATRGATWHGDPDKGGIPNGLDTYHIEITRYKAGNGLAVRIINTDPEQDDISPISQNIGQATADELTFWENHNNLYATSEMERAGIIEPTGIETTFGPHNTTSRLMRFTAPYRTPALEALARHDAETR